MMERHGYCRKCYGPVHEYPFGWAHTFIPDVTHDPDGVVTFPRRADSEPSPEWSELVNERT